MHLPKANTVSKAAQQAIVMLFALALWCLFLFMSQVAAKQMNDGNNPNQPRTLRFEKGFIIDAYGFEKPMAASSLFIPYGWRTSGGTQWGRNFACTEYMNIDWKAESPDGLSSIGILPQGAWENDNTGKGRPIKVGCTQQDIQSVQVFQQRVIAIKYPSAKLTGFKRRPDLEVRPTSSPMQGGGQTHNNTEAGETRFNWTVQGKAMEGSLTSIVHFTRSRLPVAGMADLQFLNTRANPSYVVLVSHTNTLRVNEIKEVAKRNQIWQNTNEQIAQMRTDVWNNNQRSSDRRAIEFSQFIRGIQSYQGADGQRTELTSGYNHAWKLNDGSYIFATQPNFDPRREFGIDGQRLEALR
jgi:hypothetical protein